MLEAGRRLGFDRCARLRGEELERRAGFDLVHELAGDVAAVLLANLVTHRIEPEPLRFLEGVDQQQAVGEPGQGREARVVPERHVVFAALEAFPIVPHAAEAGRQFRGQVKRSGHGRFASWADRNHKGISSTRPRSRATSSAWLSSVPGLSTAAELVTL